MLLKKYLFAVIKEKFPSPLGLDFKLKAIEEAMEEKMRAFPSPLGLDFKPTVNLLFLGYNLMFPSPLGLDFKLKCIF